MSSKRINVLSIAKYLVEEHKIKDSIKIHKLIYFIFLKYMKQKNEKLFDDEFEAWIYGPVLRKIHEHIFNYGFDFSNEKDVEEIINDNVCEKAEKIIDIEDKYVIELIDEVANVLKNFSSFDLVDKSHNTSPWIEARKNFGPLKPSKEKLKLSEMRNFVDRWNGNLV